MNQLDIKCLVLGMMQTNCYIIKNRETQEAICIDPADQAGIIEEYLTANDLVCRGILLTHGHFDHIMAAKKLAELLQVNIYAHEDEVELLADADMNYSAQMRRTCSLKPDILLKDQQILQMAGFSITVLHTPGHTAGGACYYFPEYAAVISGDTLFLESVGRSDFPTGNGTVLIESILSKLMTLEDSVKVYPGHGESTTIGHERANNFYL